MFGCQFDSAAFEFRAEGYSAMLLNSAGRRQWDYIKQKHWAIAVGRSLSLDQPSGIRFQTSSEMRLRTLRPSIFSALEVLTTIRYINQRFTYLFTYNSTLSRHTRPHGVCFVIQWYCLLVIKYLLFIQISYVYVLIPFHFLGWK